LRGNLNIPPFGVITAPSAVDTAFHSEVQVASDSPSWFKERVGTLPILGVEPGLPLSFLTTAWMTSLPTKVARSS